MQTILPTIEFKGKSSTPLISERYACRWARPKCSKSEVRALAALVSSSETSLDKCRYSNSCSNCDDSESSRDSSALSLLTKEDGDPLGKDTIFTVPPYLQTPIPPACFHS